MLSPRQRLQPFDHVFPSLNTIVQTDQNLSSEPHLTLLCSNTHEDSFQRLQTNYDKLQQNYTNTIEQLEAALLEKQTLERQLVRVSGLLYSRDNLFKKILEYVAAESEHQRHSYQLRIKILNEQNRVLRKSLPSKKKNATVTTNDMDQQLRELSQLQDGTRNTYLWSLEELFSKYLGQDSPLKTIISPILRNYIQQHQPEDILESCERMLSQLNLYEKQLKRNSKMNGLLQQFINSANGVIYSKDAQEDEDDD